MKNSLYKSKKFHNRVKFLMRSQYWTKKEFKKFQINNLKNLIFYVQNNIPFYQKFLDKKIDVEKIKTLQILNNFPIINKKIIQKDPDLFLNFKNKKKIINRTTGGSTGTPLTVWSDMDFQIKDKANTIYYTQIFGINIFKDKSVRIYGDKIPQFLINENKYWYKKDVNQLVMSSFHINSNTYDNYLKQISIHKPKYIHSRSSTIFTLARLIDENNKNFKIKLKYIFVDGEYLTKGQRRTIESVFRCRVINIYGHTEGALIGHPCAHSNYLHFMPQNGILELVDRHGKEINTDGKKGRVIATGFNNQILPLLRYETGDVGLKEKKKCKCGRNYFLLKEIEGREQDYVYDKNKKKVPLAPAIFNYNDMDWKGINEFKVIQKKPGKILVNIEKNEKYSSKEIKSRVNKKINLIFGNRIKVSSSIVKKILKTKIGKHRYLDQKIKI